MKQRRPRTTGSKNFGEKRHFSKPSYKTREDGNGPERERNSTERPYRSSRNAESGYSKGPDREGDRKSSGGDRSSKKRFSSSEGRVEKRSYGKKPWGRQPGAGSGKKSFDSKSGPARFDRDKKPFGRSEEKPERRSFDRPSGEGRSERSFGRSKYEDKPRSGGTPERRPFGAARSNDSGKPKRDFPSSGPGSRYGKDTGGFRRETSRRDGEGAPERKWNRKEDHKFYGDKKKFSKPRSFSEPMEDDGLTRLNKYISNAGICSRREADDMIKAGVISVNGVVITEMGFKVKPGDEVRYNNETLRSEKMVYLLLNKPKDFITTSDDPENRKTVLSLIENACKERVYPVGRLDRNTTGLLLFTNDGELARRLTHPSFEVQKIYQVDLDKNLKPGDMEKISSGINLEDGFIKPDAVSYVGSGSDKSVVGIELHSGKNHIVRRIFESFEYKVKKLDRVYFAGLSKKDLPRGRWRFLTEMEVASLKMMTGDKKFKSMPARENYTAAE